MIEKDFVKILKIVFDRTGISMPEILGKSRVARIAAARHLVCWLMRNKGWDYISIGEFMGSCHSTVIHSCRRINFLIKVDKIFNRAWPELSGKAILFPDSIKRKENKRKLEEMVGA